MTDQLAREVAEGLGWYCKYTDCGYPAGWYGPVDSVARIGYFDWKTDWSCAGIVLEEMRKRGRSFHLDDSPYTDDEYQWRAMFGSCWADGATPAEAIFKAAKEALSNADSG